MDMNRRSFLIGSGAAIALATAAPAFKAIQAVGPKLDVAKIELPGYRSLMDIILSQAGGRASDPSSIYRIMRNNDPLIQVALHPMALMRWVAAPGTELIFPENSALHLNIEPAYNETVITLISGDKAGKFWSETIYWERGRHIRTDRIAIDPTAAPDRPDWMG